MSMEVAAAIGPYGQIVVDAVASAVGHVRDQLRDAALGISARLDVMAEAVEGSCDTDVADVEYLDMPAAHVELLDSLRLRKPDAYHALVAAADAFVAAVDTGPLTERRPACMRAAADVLSALGTAPTNAPHTRT